MVIFSGVPIFRIFTVALFSLKAAQGVQTQLRLFLISSLLRVCFLHMKFCMGNKNWLTPDTGRDMPYVNSVGLG